MKKWRVEFIFKAIFDTSGEQPNLDKLENEVSALKDVLNLIEHTKTIKEIVGMETKP